MQCAIEFEIIEILRLKKFQKQRFLSHLGSKYRLDYNAKWRVFENRNGFITSEFDTHFLLSEISTMPGVG